MGRHLKRNHQNITNLVEHHPLGEIEMDVCFFTTQKNYNRRYLSYKSEHPRSYDCIVISFYYIKVIFRCREDCCDY
jgi:hypothetical protein